MKPNIPHEEISKSIEKNNTDNGNKCKRSESKGAVSGRIENKMKSC